MTSIPAADGFSGLASAYRQARPDYPEAMVRDIVAFTGRALAAPDALYVDVGAGTGISTASIARALPAGVAAIGVEPNDDMRGEAQAGVQAGAFETREVSFVDGRAERLPLPTGRAVLVTAGQAAHWFDRRAFYREAARVLARGGTLALFENIRDWRRSAFLDAHETFLETHSADREGRLYRRTDRDKPYAQEIFEAFGNANARSYSWTRRMTAEAFVTMAESSSQAQRALRALGREAGLAAITDNAGRHADRDGTVSVPYRTNLYLARRE